MRDSSSAPVPAPSHAAPGDAPAPGPRIPPAHLPPAFIVQRWPALGRLEDNPLFIQHYYSKKSRRGWQLQHGHLLSLGFCLLGIFLSVGPLGSWPLFALSSIGIFIVLIRMAAGGNCEQRLELFLRQTPLPRYQELWLTGLTPDDILSAYMAPWFSRRRFWMLGVIYGILAVLFAAIMLVFELHPVFVAAYIVILGTMAWMGLSNKDAFLLVSLRRHLKKLDAFSGSPLSERWGRKVDHAVESTVQSVAIVISGCIFLFLIIRLAETMEFVWIFLGKWGLVEEAIILFIILVIFIFFLICWRIVVNDRARNTQEIQIYLARLWEMRAQSESERRE